MQSFGNPGGARVVGDRGFRSFLRSQHEAAVGVGIVTGRRCPDFHGRVALHEAGHCVGALAFNLPLAGVTIEFINGHHGSTWGSDSSRDDPESVGSICAELAPLMSDVRAEELALARGMVVALLAGPLAEDLVIGSRLPNCEHDEADAREIAALICRSPSAIDAYLDFCAAEADALLRNHAGMVLALADVLLERRTLDRPEIDEIVRGKI
jgi:hypothetical protein